MAERVLVDNDVAFKISCYALCNEMVAAVSLEAVPPALLGVARFVVRGHLARASTVSDRKAAIGEFEVLLRAVASVEPDEVELTIAADLEAEASRQNLELDGGESQLIAILVNRGSDLLLTGDKRAIIAMSSVAPQEARGRVACLEQLMGEIVRQTGTEVARGHVCKEPGVDKAVSACFACSSATAISEYDVFCGLGSYVGDLTRRAPNMLVGGNDLRAITANRSASGPTP